MLDIFNAILGMLKSVFQDIIQDRLVAAWSDSTWGDFMGKQSVISYIVDSTVMDAFDDIQEYGINPWYHPVASFKQVIGPLARFFWECFGRSPVFWLILSVWTIRWAYSNYDFHYMYVVEDPLDDDDALDQGLAKINHALAANALSLAQKAQSLAEDPLDDDDAQDQAVARVNQALATNALALAQNAQFLAENTLPAENAENSSNNEETPAPAENAPAPAENPENPSNDVDTPAPADSTPAPAAEHAPAPAEDAPAPAENAPAPNGGNAPATAAENTPLAENTLIPNGAAPAENGKA